MYIPTQIIFYKEPWLKSCTLEELGAWTKVLLTMHTYFNCEFKGSLKDLSKESEVPLHLLALLVDRGVLEVSRNEVGLYPPYMEWVPDEDRKDYLHHKMGAV